MTPDEIKREDMRNFLLRQEARLLQEIDEIIKLQRRLEEE